MYSADMFYTAFAADPMSEEAGRRYRYVFLQPGASQPESKTLQDFLGRNPSSDAFLKSFGLPGHS